MSFRYLPPEVCPEENLEQLLSPNSTAFPVFSFVFVNGGNVAIVDGQTEGCLKLPEMVVRRKGDYEEGDKHLPSTQKTASIAAVRTFGRGSEIVDHPKALTITRLEKRISTDRSRMHPYDQARWVCADSIAIIPVVAHVNPAAVDLYAKTRVNWYPPQDAIHELLDSYDYCKEAPTDNAMRIISFALNKGLLAIG